MLARIVPTNPVLPGESSFTASQDDFPGHARCFSMIARDWLLSADNGRVKAKLGLLKAIRIVTSRQALRCGQSGRLLKSTA